MEFQDVVRKRRMVRAFEDWPIPSEVVQRILANAQRGPSSGFAQGFEFLVFDGPEQTGRFWHAIETVGGWEPDSLRRVGAAPLILVPFAHEQAYVDRYLAPDKAAAGRQTGTDFPAPYWYIDSAFAAMLVLLSAVDAGLGAFYFSVGSNRREIPAFCAALGIPAGYYPIGAIAIGYPSENDPSQPRIKGRRPPAAMLHLGAW